MKIKIFHDVTLREIITSGESLVIRYKLDERQKIKQVRFTNIVVNQGNDKTLFRNSKKAA